MNLTLNAQNDSVKTYNLNEVMVKSGFILQPKLVTEINLKKIEHSDAAAISDLARFIPSVKLQTNSRGESLFYLRGSNERQLALFFDGVPLNIPWDSRIDLSMIPTTAIGELSISKGIPSVVYGANTLAGVINIDPVPNNEKKIKSSLQLGQNDFQKYSLFVSGGDSAFSHLATFVYNKSDGFRLPSDYKSKFEKNNIRLNSKKESLNLFTKLKYAINEYSKIGLSFSYIDSEKEVPPEMDVKKPRYWRYPLWQKFTTAFTGENKFGKSLDNLLVYSFSFTKFKMQIDQFNDISYSKIDQTEKDKDVSLTGRLVYTKFINTNSILKLSFNGYTTNHKENVFDNELKKNISSKYSQSVISFGSEYEFIHDKFTSILGIGLDGVITPNTGSNPEKENEYDYGINYSFIYSINPTLSAQLNMGRKTRFPSLRESYSEALGKFKINPNLKPEIAYTIETGLNKRFEKSSLNFNLFLTYLNEGIVIKKLDDGSKIRVNKENIRSYGFEVSSQHNLFDNLSANINLTYMNSFAKNDEGDYKDTLEYKPQIISGINISYNPIKDLNIILEVDYIGNEFSDQESFKKMPDHFLVNTRLTYFINLFDTRLESFVRINNLFDKLYFTQWSLPESGRQYWFGLSAEF